MNEKRASPPGRALSSQKAWRCPPKSSQKAASGSNSPSILRTSSVSSGVASGFSRRVRILNP